MRKDTKDHREESAKDGSTQKWHTQLQISISGFHQFLMALYLGVSVTLRLRFFSIAEH